MGRIKLLGLAAVFLVGRGVAAIFPAGIAYFVLMPYSLLRGLIGAVVERNLPVSRLPSAAGDPRPGFGARWRFQAAIHHRWLMLFWSDRWKEPRWSSRFSDSNTEIIDLNAAQRPIIVMTIHTTAMILLGAWLANRGLGVGSVIVDPRVWVRGARMREASRNDERFSHYRDSQSFLRGDARSMVRYLQPGRCMFLPADHERGRVVHGAWSGGMLRLASGGFRMARLSGAVVIPVIVTDAGRWRFHVDVRQPVPQNLIDTEDDVGAASYVAEQLMAIAAERPGEAAVTLVEATAVPPRDPTNTPA